MKELWMRCNIQTKIVEKRGQRLIDPFTKENYLDVPVPVKIHYSSSFFRPERFKKSGDKAMVTIVDLFDDNGEWKSRHIFMLSAVPRNISVLKYDPILDAYLPKIDQINDKTKNYFAMVSKLDKAIRHTYAKLAAESLRKSA